MRIVLIILMSMTYVFSHAHSSKEAYFNIYKSEESIDVFAEFPWTIRNAFFTFKPELEQERDINVFNDTFFSYVNQNFIIQDENNTPLELLKVKKINTNAHSHQTNYIFKFKSGQLKQISNTLMFNINKEQVNYHTLYFDTDTLKYASSLNKSSFFIGDEKPNNWIKTSLIIVLIILTAILLLKPFIKA